MLTSLILYYLCPCNPAQRNQSYSKCYLTLFISGAPRYKSLQASLNHRCITSVAKVHDSAYLCVKKSTLVGQAIANLYTIFRRFLPTFIIREDINVGRVAVKGHPPNIPNGLERCPMSSRPLAGGTRRHKVKDTSRALDMEGCNAISGGWIFRNGARTAASFSELCKG